MRTTRVACPTCTGEVERVTRRPREGDRPRAAPTREQLEAAQQLRGAPRGLHEDNVRRNVGDLLGSFGIEYTLSYPTPGGPADLYLQRRRTIIETKARGLVGDPRAPQARENNETPLDQLERYLLSELRSEKSDARVRRACPIVLG